MKSLRNKAAGDAAPFIMSEKPGRQSLLLLPLIWVGSFLMTRSGRLKIDCSALKDIKPPFLVLAEHQGFTDYFITPLALFPHRASYVSDIEGFAVYGKKLYGMLGCIPTRRFTIDYSLVANIRHVIEKNRDILVIYPEARHSNVGTNSMLPDSVGKLVKLLKIPVVVLKTHGSYLTSPIWDESHRRKVPLSAVFKQVLHTQDIEALTADAITERLNGHFKYDEYCWQNENRIRIDYPRRAEGLHRILYRCPCCETECAITSHEKYLECTACGKSWEMDEYGRLSATAGDTEYPHIPDWYESQRQAVEQEIRSGKYFFEESVQVEALPNEKGFIEMGIGHLKHESSGFILDIPGEGKHLTFLYKTLSSVHTEYNYREKGDCLVLSTRDCCYYLYFESNKVNVTRLQFAAEYFYHSCRSDKRQ